MCACVRVCWSFPNQAVGGAAFQCRAGAAFGYRGGHQYSASPASFAVVGTYSTSKKRWRDVISSDLSLIGTPLNWYTEAQNRQQWRDRIPLFRPLPQRYRRSHVYVGVVASLGDLAMGRRSQATSIFLQHVWLSSLTRWAS